MFEIPDDDDLFSEDNLKGIFNEVSDNTRQQKTEADTTKDNVSHFAASTNMSDILGVEESLGSPQSKKQRVLTDVNHQPRPMTMVQKAETVSADSGTSPSVSNRPVEHFISTHMPEQSLQADVAALPRRRSLRKFPGPAGILPPAKPTELASVMRKSVGATPEVFVDDESNKPEEEVCSSQSSCEVFGGAAWQSLLVDLEPGAGEVLRKFSVQAMLHKASRRSLPKGKVPLMFGVLDSVDFQGTDASVVVRDRTGQMQGTLHREVFRDFSTDLQAGAALVLRQVSVISPSQRTHYLNITTGNIVAIYPATGSCTQAVLPTLSEQSSITQPSQEMMKNFVHAAEIELLEAANVAKETALKRLHERSSAASNSSPGTPGPARFNQRSPGLFGNRPQHTPRGSSPSLFTPPRARMSALPQGPAGGRFTHQNTASQIRTPFFRAPTQMASSPVVNPRMMNSACSSHTPHPSSNQGMSVRIQPVACGAASGAGHTPFRNNVNSHILNSQSGTPVSSRFNVPSVPCVSSSAGHPRLGNETAAVATNNNTAPTPLETSTGGYSQQSKWTFKQKPSGLSASAATNSNPDCNPNVNRTVLQQTGSGEPSAKAQRAGIGNSGTVNSPVGPGVCNGGTAGVSNAKNSAAAMSSNMWDDELSDDILSQLSDDF